jgi:hypothetical protein
MIASRSDGAGVLQPVRALGDPPSMTSSGEWRFARAALVAIWELDEAGFGPTSGGFIEPVAIIDYLKIDASENNVKHALKRLGTAGYIELVLAGGGTVEVKEIHERTFARLGGWPSGPADSVTKAMLAASSGRWWRSCPAPAVTRGRTGRRVCELRRSCSAWCR